MVEGAPRGRKPANTPVESVVEPEVEVTVVPEDPAVEAPSEEATALVEALAELKAMKQQIADLQKQAARPVTVDNSSNPLNKKQYTKAAPGEKFLVHWIRDGSQLLGKPMYTGDVLQFDPNSQAYKDTEDIYGFSVLELRNDPQAQERMLGHEFFREGPWTGKSYADIEFEQLRALAGEEGLNLPSREELEALEAHERARVRSAEPLAPLRGAPRTPGY